MQQASRSRTCHQCGNIRSGLANETEAVGSKRESERVEVRCEVFRCQEESRLSEELFEVGVSKLIRMGLVFVRVLGKQAVGISPAERLKLRRQMAAAAGKKVSVSRADLMEVNDLEVKEDLSTLATLFGAEVVWMEKRAERSLEEAGDR